MRLIKIIKFKKNKSAYDSIKLEAILNLIEPFLSRL